MDQDTELLDSLQHLNLIKKAPIDTLNYSCKTVV